MSNVCATRPAASRSSRSWPPRVSLRSMRIRSLEPLAPSPGVSSCIPRSILSWQCARGKRPFTIVMYHSIGEPSDNFTIGPGALREQLRLIRRTYEVVRLAEVRTSLLQEELRRQVALTFDDAYEDFYESAYPILRELSLPCTVFVPTGYVGKSNEWDKGTGLALRSLMDRGQICELASSALVDFGSHSVDHLSMRRLTAEQMRRQAVDSKHALEDLLGRPVMSFAYPYGTMDDFSKATRTALLAAGYEIAVTSRWGTMNRASDLLALKRISFKQSDGSRELIAKLEGRYDWLAIKERLGLAARRLAKLRTRRSEVVIGRTA
jgi:peptidoglycan/xylan/chitin deacetylase (PgdA/CDA1 family)